jgi:type VI protein secretion system component Hcp
MSFDAFMKVDGVDGESLDDGHKGWVELLSYHYDAMQSISEFLLEEVLIALVSGQGAEQSGFPVEVVTLNYGRIKFEYSQQRRADGGSAGVVSGGWDRTANKAFA